MEKTINKPEGETGRLIDTQFWSLNQTKKKTAHFTASVLCAHLCLWNCDRLFQLHARLERGVVTIDVPLGANLCKNQSHGVKTSLYRLFYFTLLFLWNPFAGWSTCVTAASARKRTRQQHDSWHDGRKVDIKRMKFDFSSRWPWAAAAFTESLFEIYFHFKRNNNNVIKA